jgi:hypothetical protein
MSLCMSLPLSTELTTGSAFEGSRELAIALHPLSPDEMSFSTAYGYWLVYLFRARIVRQT